MNKKKQREIRQETLRQLIATKKKALRGSPDGYLQISTSHGMTQYYRILGNRQEGRTYLTKNDLELARALAQKTYDRKVLQVAEQELRAWQALARLMPDTTAEEVIKTLSPARQKLVTPIIPPDEEFRKQWEAVTYEPGWFKDGTAVYITDRGERVRSKSEQLIANLLFRLGIPYRYEYPIEVIVNGRRKIWRPDFTILDVRNRKELYLEHFGKLDDQEESDNYARNAFGKMKVYEENGMFEGGCMIYSFETGKAPLDINYLERKLRRVLGLSSGGDSRQQAHRSNINIC